MLNWDEYIKKGDIRKTTPNKGRVNVLIKMSDNIIDAISALTPNEQNASVIFVNYYDALREICEAVSLLRGYKIYSHEAIGLFLKGILKEESTFVKFDKFRIMRNGVNYYGTPIPLSEVLEGIRDIKQIISKLKLKYLNEFS